jgi:hypothetical protein
VNATRRTYALVMGLAALLVVYAAMLGWIAAREPEGPDGRILTFAGVLAATAAVVAVGPFVASASLRAIGLSVAGAAVSVVGTFGAATIGLPLLPVGIGLLIAAVVIAEGTPAPRMTWIACAAAALLVAASLSAIALAGRA